MIFSNTLKPAMQIVNFGIYHLVLCQCWSYFLACLPPLQKLSHPPLLISKFIHLEKQDYFLEGWKLHSTSRCHFSCWLDCRPVFLLHLPLVGSFLWSVLSAVHHGSQFKQADVVQLLAWSASICWHWGTDQRQGMNNLALWPRENRIWRVIKLLLWLKYENSMIVNRSLGQPHTYNKNKPLS